MKKTLILSSQLFILFSRKCASSFIVLLQARLRYKQCVFRIRIFRRCIVRRVSQREHHQLGFTPRWVGLRLAGWREFVYLRIRFTMIRLNGLIISGWIISASFGGIFGLCLGGSVMSVIELVYLLVREVFRRQLRKGQEQSHARLPPASKMFLTIPAKEKVQLQKLRDHQGSNRRVFVTWYQPDLHHRKTTNLEMYRKHVKF